MEVWKNGRVEDWGIGAVGKVAEGTRGTKKVIALPVS
jgi:hypothetical protein